MKVALFVRSGYSLHERKSDDALFFPIPVIQFWLQVSGNAKKLLSVIGPLQVTNLGRGQNAPG